MARKPNAEDVITLEIINDKELFKLFNELQTSVQNRIVINGFKNAAQVIKNEIKSSFISVRKNKSKTGYKNLKDLKIEPMKSAVGVKVGFTREGYKYRWIQWGTKERKTKKGYNRGIIDETNFFYGAVERSMPQAQNKVSECIVKSLENTVKKYEGANHK